jgi:hypothetical protein
MEAEAYGITAKTRRKDASWGLGWGKRSDEQEVLNWLRAGVHALGRTTEFAIAFQCSRCSLDADVVSWVGRRLRSRLRNGGASLRAAESDPLFYTHHTIQLW